MMAGIGKCLRFTLAALALAQMAVQVDAQSSTQTTPQAANADGTTFAKNAKTTAASIPDQQVDANNVPGYQPAPDSMSNLFGSSDTALMGQAGAATSGDAWTTMLSADANRSRVDPASLKDILDKAEEINENASGSSTETGAGGGQGQCQEVTKSATQVYYDATCDVGDTITTADPVMQYSCPAGWSLSGTTCSYTQTQAANVSYSCPNGGTLQGTNCVSTQPASISGYTCPSGFSLSGTSCTQTQTQAASVSGYSCPADYTLQGNTCVRTLQQSATPVYSCPSGYNLSGTTCTSTATYQATPSYSCPGGYVLSGTTCSQTLTQPAATNVSCPSGWVLNNGTCAMQTSYTATATSTCPAGWIPRSEQCSQDYSYAANIIYTCPAKTYLDGGQCWTNQYQCGPGSGEDYKVVDGKEVCGTPKNWYASRKCPTTNSKYLFERKVSGESYCFFTPNSPYQCPKDHWIAPDSNCNAYSHYAVAPTVNYNCPNGGSLSGTTCYGTNYVGAAIEYSCPNGGSLSGTTCIVNQTTAPTVTYSCPGGYSLSGTTCSVTNTQGASVSYSCPSGGTLSGTTCTTTSSQPANVTYNCPANWVLSGNQCTSTLSQTATPIYTCPVGYDLSGSMCSRTEVQPATAQYACPANYSLSGTTCTLTTAAQVNYGCPPDFSLSGTTCSQTLTQTANGTLVCSDTAATMQDGKCYGTATKTDCEELAGNPQCSFVRDTCLDEVQSGPCRVTEKTYSCPVPGDQGPANKEYMCGGDMYCVGGACQQIEREASNELKDALVALGAIDQAHKEFDPDKLDMFRGTRETCHKPIFGMVNCCAGKVSGLLTGGSAALAWTALGSGGITAIAGIATQFLTTFMCSNAEKQLDVKDRLGLCHFVGSYCSSSFLGVCETKKKVYCCFESKLSRILQEQGRPQINKPWAKPKEETCQGFTIDEFSRLDLSQMDFSEIYSEFLEAAKLPDEAQMATDIQAKIRAYYEQNGAN